MTVSVFAWMETTWPALRAGLPGLSRQSPFRNEAILKLSLIFLQVRVINSAANKVKLFSGLSSIRRGLHPPNSTASFKCQRFQLGSLCKLPQSLTSVKARWCFCGLYACRFEECLLKIQNMSLCFNYTFLIGVCIVKPGYIQLFKLRFEWVIPSGPGKI